MSRRDGGRPELPPRTLKIVIASDAPWHTTGYGTQTAVLSRKLAEDGHRVYVYAPGAFHGGFVELEGGVTVLSSHFGDDRWGNVTLDHYLEEIQPDLLISWLDCQGMGQYGWYPGVSFYPWVPVDTWPSPKLERAVLGRADRILASSRWGCGVLEQSDLKAEYVPCGLDMEAYDINEEGRCRWRAQLCPPIAEHTYLIGMVGLNTGSPDRKGYGYAFDVIRAFVDQHPGKDIRAYIHTNPAGDAGAINLIDLRAELRLEDIIAFPKPMSPRSHTPLYMRDMYNAFDALLHTSLTEGFGLPVIEAQACGTPVVANSCSSVTEIVKSGYLAEPLGDMWVETSTKVAIPSVRALLTGLYTVRDAGTDRQEVREKMRPFEWGHVYETYWRPIMAAFEPRPDYTGGERKLALGAGSERKEGYVHHDKFKVGEHIDVIHDLNAFPWPWDAESWDYIEMSDVLEHLRGNVTDVMDELWRITAPGGYVLIHTAEAGSWQLLQDPTHVRGFAMDAFDYYDPETQWGQIYPYSERKWEVVKKTADSAGLIFILRPRKAGAEEKAGVSAVEVKA